MLISAGTLSVGWLTTLQSNDHDPQHPESSLFLKLASDPYRLWLAQSQIGTSVRLNLTLRLFLLVFSSHFLTLCSMLSHRYSAFHCNSAASVAVSDAYQEKALGNNLFVSTQG
jgi:hypothetical protein